MQLIQSDEPEFYLFLSVDIIDSTKKKYNDDLYTQGWTQYFYSFFSEFPGIFDVCLKSEEAKINDEKIDKDIVINPWKYAGDEILFYIKIKQKRQVPVIVKAFANALEKWDKGQKDKKEQTEQSNQKFIETELKGCIWTGQFPFIDRKFVYYEDDETNKKTDFIGPSIDCGFRLGKYASKRGIVISIEVIDLCIDTDLCHNITFYKSEKLKGVGNMEYPIFNYLLSEKSKNIIEKDILTATNAALEKFLDDYYKEKEENYKGRISRVNQNKEEHLTDYLEAKTKEWELVSNIIEISDVPKNISNAIQDDKKSDNDKLNSIVDEIINANH